VESASGVPGDCYTISMLDPSKIPHKPAKKASKPATAPAPAAKPAAKKEPKIPVFKEPKVVDDVDVTDEWLFEPPPPEVRSRKHIETILHLVRPSLCVSSDTLFALRSLSYSRSLSG
jgi:hypothetical protein